MNSPLIMEKTNKEKMNDMDNRNPRKNQTGIIVFCLFSVLYLAVCALLLLPQIRPLIISILENALPLIKGKFERHPEIFASYAVLGFAFYVFVLFLLALEKFIIKRGAGTQNDWEILFIIAMTILSALIRAAGFGHKSGDYIYHLSPWVSYLRENGHFFGFRNFPGNYNALYMYILGILSYLPKSLDLYLIKAVSCVFDYICAVFSMKIILQITQNKKISLLTYAIILFSPTVFLNSGVWAQCDSIHTAFILISFYCLLNGRILPAMIWFGIGLSSKPQAVFSLPFIMYLFVYRKTSMKNLLYSFIGFFGISIPAWLFGWPLIQWVANYGAGTDLAPPLTHNAPTVFTWGNIPGMIPVMFIAAVLLCIGFLVINKEEKPSYNTILLLFLFCNFAVPFFLPNMHERYFYTGEIAVLLYAIVNPTRFWISFAVIMPALATYSRSLWGNDLFSLVHLSYFMLFAVIVISKWLIESIVKDQNINQGQKTGGGLVKAFK